MSTFKGIIDEFPDIRIDYFRPSKDPDARAPLACFLTHIHSDHIQGLDGFYGGPFIHCSAATKELLLRLERRTHRWNHAKGVLEARKCQYAEKRNKLKVIPLETPTVVELSSERSVRVTLFDANHCPGAVMFLIEGDGKAVLYTGDIRAESWWVDYLARHPILIPYTTGIKRLDKIYLDTTFAARKKTHKLFSPKREGIQELIEKVGKYPQDTIFHFNTWTFGYEDVWVALGAAFNSQIHPSKYHFRLFTFIRSPEIYTQGPYLRGYKFGNTDIAGCLTTNPDVRFHSCERRSGCPGLEGKKNVVWITPIITRMGDFEVHEGGSGDLETQDDLVLHENHLQSLLDTLGRDVDPRVRELLQSARNTRKQALPLVLGGGQEAEDLGLEEVVEMLSKSALNKGGDSNIRKDHIADASILASNGELLPNKITFPYPRHSSHSELRGLVAAFRPRDIYPCVVDEEYWDETKTMEYLFGDLCEGNHFAHDQEMKRKLDEEMRIQEELEEEREMYEMQSQTMLDRTQGESFIDMQLFKERLEDSKRYGEEVKPEPYAGIKALGSSTASNSPTTSRPATPRPLKRPAEDDGDDDTPRAKKPNYSNELLSSPPLPPLPDAGLALLNLTPLEKARMAGSSTASSSPQSSPVKPRPSRPTERIVRIKQEESPLRRKIKDESEQARTSQSGEYLDAFDKRQTTPRARYISKALEPEIVSRQESMDEEEVQEAMEAALGVDGRSWWDVELVSTREKWRYKEELEL